MATFEVKIGDAVYDVDAPDENTAWKWANQTHGTATQSRQKDALDNPNMAVEGMSTGDKLLAGAGKGMSDVGRGIAQFFGNPDVTRQRIDEINKQDAPLMGTREGTVGNIAGSVAASLPAALIPGAGTLAGAAVIGGAQGLMAPVGEQDSRLKNAGMGLAGGVAGNLAARGLARVAQPITQTEPVKKLLSEGVVPTPGQAAGANSFVGKMEQKLQSIPIVGDIITKGRTRAIDELNKAAMNRSLPNGERITTIGRAAMQKADEIFDDAYRSALDGVTVKIGSGLDDAVKAVRADPEIFLDKNGQQNLTNVLKLVKDQFKNGEMSGELAKKVDSQLGSISRTYGGSANASDREFASAVKQVQASFREILADGAGPEKAAALKEINGKYANFLRVQRASGYVGAKDGVFSPAQLQSAVRSMDASRNKGAFARGNALMQDLSESGVSVLGNTVPNSGTVDRAMLAMLAGGGAAGANEYFGGPGYLTALGLAPLLYSRTGSRYLVGDLAGQGAAAAAARATLPYASTLGASLSK